MSQSADQFLRGEWLTQQGDAASFQGLYFGELILARRHEYDGESEAGVHELSRKISAAIVAELNIENEADRLGRRHSAAECRGRRVELCAISIGRQQTPHGIEDAGVIINYCNNRMNRRHSSEYPEYARTARPPWG